MKRVQLIALLAVVIAACNNADKNTASGSLEKKADSLFKQVMHGHDVGMAKDFLLEKTIALTQKTIDSINTLPIATRTAAAAYKQQLDSLLKDLNYADFAMNKWMEEMNWEPSKIEINERIKYLTAEKEKVDKVSEAILGSLAKADSLLKAVNR
ncbi:MAG TPA: hypothetical protein VF476_08335 [Chitinophagaceae bacterium]